MQADGTVSDPSGIAISTAPNNQTFVAVSSDGSQFFVVWADNRSGSDYDIYGSRVLVDGTVSDPSGIAIATGSESEFSPAVASDGSQFLVGWYANRGSGNDVYGSRVQTNGTVSDPGGIAICTAPNSQHALSVASDGTQFLVAWTDLRSGDYDIYGSRLQADGTVSDPSGIAISTGAPAYYPQVASDGAEFLVVWQDGRRDIPDVYGCRIQSDGTLLDPTGLVIAAGVGREERPTVSSGHGLYAIAYQRTTPVVRSFVRLLWTTCGDGTVDTHEPCDDGNLVGGDGCSAGCAIEPGYACTGAGPSICTDVDECAGEGAGNDCDPNATCTNTTGSFTCACNAGFIGDGFTCTADLDGGVDAGTASDAGIDASTAGDAGMSDAGSDAGMSDAGFDAGMSDAGFDAGMSDAGSDAGMASDAGIADVTDRGGCGCRVTSTERFSTLGPLGWLAAVGLLLRRRRSRRRQPRARDESSSEVT